MDIAISRGAFDGLYSYEIALLAMGFALFGVAVWALIRAARRGSSLAVPLAVLPFVLVFAGYPSVQRIRFSNALDTASELVTDPGRRPASADEHREAEQKLALAAGRASTPQQRAVVAAAFSAIGEVDKGYALVEEIVAQGAADEVAMPLTVVYEAKLAREVPIDASVTVTDPTQRSRIANLVQQLDSHREVLPAGVRVTLARGYAAIGDDDRAARSLDEARDLEQDLSVDSRLQRRLAPVGADTGDER